MKKVMVIDAQGGGIGKQLISLIVNQKLDINIVAVGTNSTATAQMLKAGAIHGATGENPVVVGCRDADIIMGPIGIVIADSMFGEITPEMACAIGQSRARKILIPINHCNNYVVGVADLNLKVLLTEAVDQLTAIVDNG